MREDFKLSRIEVMEPEMVRVMKSKTPEERLAMVFDANRTIRLVLEAHFRDRHPEWDQARIQAAIAQRLLRGSG
ncbi:MAG TPA: hypothetical protein VGH74_18460 [Planctomycetaceae bacterium]|jgi:hypothetical protein